MFKIGLVSFLPSVRSFARSYVRRYISLYARAAYGVVHRLRLHSRRAVAAAADGSKGVVITELAVSVSVCALKRSPFLFSRVNQLLPMTTVELRSSASRSSYTRRVALLPPPSPRRCRGLPRQRRHHLAQHQQLLGSRRRRRLTFEIRTLLFIPFFLNLS